MVKQKNVIKIFTLTTFLASCVISILGFFSVEPSARQQFYKVFAYDILKKNSQQLELNILRSTTEQITVSISSQDTFGSGTIIGFREPFYQVITNAHVIRGNPDNLMIMTSNKKKHRVYSIETEKFKPYDLAVLTFLDESSIYTVAKLGNSAQLKVNEPIVASGFSANSEKIPENSFSFSQGHISFIASKPLDDGYSIGYTNLIEKGMSGGPILNMAGELVAINGIHAYPLWGNLYEQNNLKILSPLTSEQINQLSWAISVDTFLSKKLSMFYNF